MKIYNQQHSYHMVTLSPWPLVAALGAFITTFGGVMYMHGFNRGGLTLCVGLLILVLSMLVWWRDVIRESTFEGMHSPLVELGLRMGMVLFITSEIMFFFAFFWAYFHSSLGPVVEIGSLWPPKGIVTFNPLGIPLLNTYILLLSGVTITYTHHYLINGSLKAEFGFIVTLYLAIFFTFLQVYEYIEAPFSIFDAVYGSSFFMATGFHGFHVIIGTIFITICFLRFQKGHFSKQHHFGFEAAAWYWHFVDVVWLFLFISIYCWGGYILE